VGYNELDNTLFILSGEVGIMGELKLELSDKAREKIKGFGGEGYVIVRRLGAG